MSGALRQTCLQAVADASSTPSDRKRPGSLHGAKSAQARTFAVLSIGMDGASAALPPHIGNVRTA